MPWADVIDAHGRTVSVLTSVAHGKAIARVVPVKRRFAVEVRKYAWVRLLTRARPNGTGKRSRTWETRGAAKEAAEKLEKTK